MKPLKRNITIKPGSIDEENRSIEFMVTDETVDRHRTVFKRSGWDTTAYEMSPIFTYNHAEMNTESRSDPNMVLGTSEIRFEGNQMIARAFFEPSEINPLAETVWQKVKHGTLRSVSISALPRKARKGDESLGEDRSVVYFTDQELLAWSITPVGSNPNAQLRSIEETELISSLIEDEIITPITDPYTARSTFLKFKQRTH